MRFRAFLLSGLSGDVALVAFLSGLRFSINLYPTRSSVTPVPRLLLAKCGRSVLKTSMVPRLAASASPGNPLEMHKPPQKGAIQKVALSKLTQPEDGFVLFSVLG